MNFKEVMENEDGPQGPMNVGELIERLQGLPKESKLIISHEYNIPALEIFGISICGGDMINPSGDAWEPKSFYETEWPDEDISHESIMTRKGDIFILARDAKPVNTD